MNNAAASAVAEAGTYGDDGGADEDGDQQHARMAPGVRSPTGQITRKPTGYPRDEASVADQDDHNVQFDANTQYSPKHIIQRQATGTSEGNILNFS